MRSIEVSSQFKRDAKKNYLSLLTPAWGEVLNCLTNDLPIPKKYKDHALTGNYKGCLLYTSPSPRDRTRSRMPSSA